MESIQIYIYQNMHINQNFPNILNNNFYDCFLYINIRSLYQMLILFFS